MLAYLAQIEGGLSTSERRTRQATSGGTGGVAAGGVEVGASASRQEFVEQVVTPTATTRFYRLLDRLLAKGYLAEVDMATRPAATAAAIRDVDEGEFVRLRGCRLATPTYARMLQLVRRSRGTLAVQFASAGIGVNEGTDAAAGAQATAQALAHPERGSVGTALFHISDESRRAGIRAGRRYSAAVGADPPTAYASCAGETRLRPRGIDLLVPLRLRALGEARTLLSGPVTIVGKVIRRVRTDRDVYVDEDALAAWSRGVEGVQAELAADGGEPQLAEELAADVTVLPPGLVVLPIAIYK